MRTLAKVIGVLAVCALVSAPAAGAATTNVKANGHLKLTRIAGPVLTFSGPVRSTPFGRGRLITRVRLHYTYLTTTFTVKLKHGTVRGRGRADIGYRAAFATFKGTASFTGGTGVYRHMRAKDLSFVGQAPIILKSSVFRLAGKVRY